ncbi:metalloregulator ArsR/SmtB family transcription factor [Pseudofrankia saprophytica]|nr:metalloregulator ArsR/SmtB family transcription factor [Pseudofrankia saprophytica]
MARAATTSDVFNAIAEPQRREILVLLRAGERPVTELAQELGMTQPGASKHLRVLREVGLVRDRRAGKQRLYGLDAFESVLTFAPDGAATRIEMRTVFPTRELRDEAVEKYHAIEGGQQTLNNLAAYVTEIIRTGAED